MYSNELANMIKGLLQVSPNFRPSCDQILKMKMIQKRIELIKMPPEFAIMVPGSSGT
jgi:hypothetical protein